MKIVFATGNPTKAKRFSKGLEKYDIEVLSLKDLNVSIDVLENGENVIENAMLKARECYKKTGMPSMGMDDSLYLEGVPLDKQPGFIHAMWCGDVECENRIKEIKGCKSRCIVENGEKIDDKCVCCGKEAKHHVIWGIQY